MAGRGGRSMSLIKENLIECWVIITILAIAAYMFIRSHKKVWAGSVLPLMSVPFVSIIYYPIDRNIFLHSPMMSYKVRIVLYIVVFAISCFWIIRWARKLPAGKSRYAYTIVSISFTFLLILIFLRNLVFNPYFGIF